MTTVAGRGVASGRGGTTGTITDDSRSGSSNAGVSQREDLANFISMITRDETPFMSSIGKTKATAIFHEWQTDELQAPGDSTIAEGTDYIIPGRTGSSATNPERDALGNVAGQAVGADFAVVGPNRTRLGNYAQINGKTIAVSGTRRVVDQAGVADEYAYQLKKRGTELRRDVEHNLIHTYQIADGSGNRKLGGYQSFINDARTVNIVGTGVTAAATPGTGRTSVTATGTPVGGALALSDVDEVMQKIYQEGGKATKIMVSPKLRRDFSDLMVTDTGVRRNIDMDGKLRQSVDVYMSDFGDLMVVPNYIMGLSYNTLAGDTGASFDAADSAALIYDPMWFSIATLRPLSEVDVGQRGDSTIGMLVEECSLEVKNPVGCGAIYNLA